jgi:uncharacterized protein YaaQ
MVVQALRQVLKQVLRQVQRVVQRVAQKRNNLPSLVPYGLRIL